MPKDEDMKLREFINGLINENKLLVMTVADLNKQIEELKDGFNQNTYCRTGQENR